MPPPKRKRLARLLAVLGVLFIAYLPLPLVLRPWYTRWGSTRDELRTRLPGDELVTGPVTYGIQHAVTIEAPVNSVRPWLAQMGQTRGGFYSYAGVENLMGLKIVNADRIHPEWQAVAVGDTIFCCPPDWLGLDRRFGWRIGLVEPGEVIVLENWGAFGSGPSARLRWHRSGSSSSSPCTSSCRGACS